MARRPSKLAKWRGLSLSCSSTTAGGMPSTGTAFGALLRSETGALSSFDTLIGQRFAEHVLKAAGSRARPRNRRTR